MNLLKMDLVISILLIMSYYSVFCHPSRPLNERSTELAWQAWLLVDDQNQNRQNNSEAVMRRRITPKSIFIAPTFSPEALPECAEGYRADSMGRCIQIIKLDEDAQLDFLLQRLNEKLGDFEDYEDEEEMERLPTPGPFQVNIPLDENGDSSGSDPDIAIVVAPTNGNFDLTKDIVKKINVKRTQEAGVNEKPKTTLPPDTTTDFEMTDTTTLSTTLFERTTIPDTIEESTESMDLVADDAFLDFVDYKTERLNEETFNIENTNKPNTEMPNVKKSNSEISNTEISNIKTSNEDTSNTEKSNTDNPDDENSNTENPNKDNQNRDYSYAENMNVENSNTERLRQKYQNSENLNTEYQNMYDSKTETTIQTTEYPTSITDNSYLSETTPMEETNQQALFFRNPNPIPLDTHENYHTQKHPQIKIRFPEENEPLKPSNNQQLTDMFEDYVLGHSANLKPYERHIFRHRGTPPSADIEYDQYVAADIRHKSHDRRQYQGANFNHRNRDKWNWNAQQPPFKEKSEELSPIVLRFSNRAENTKHGGDIFQRTRQNSESIYRNVPEDLSYIFGLKHRPSISHR